MSRSVEELLKKDFNGQTIEEHLLKVISTLVTRSSSDAYANFEVVSRFIKEGKQPQDMGQCPGLKDALDKTFASMKMPGAGAEEGEGGDVKLCGVPDVAWEMDKLKWASVGFSEPESFAIACSLRQLATVEGLEQVRFWGKILGTKQDYYVAEGKAPFAGEDLADDIEKPGEKGLNFYTYWVTTSMYSVATDWVMLPLATKDLVRQARKVKKLFTGDLEAPVITHPHFAGVEKHLLRTQIARISAGTVLAPKGYFKIEGEGEEAAVVPAGPAGEGEEGGYTFPLAKELASPDMWVHAREHIFKTGKTTAEPKPEEEGEGEDGGAALKRYEENVLSDPVVAPIRQVSEDAVPTGPSWSVTASYDPTERAKLVPGEEGEPATEVVSSYQVVAVKSLRWLGATCVYQDAHFVNIYCGYGWPQGTFFPCAPEPVLDDVADPESHFEPNPETEPVPVQEEAPAEG